MALEQMYKGMPFSPTATLIGNISATDTIIPVSDVDAFPDAPNIATIGSIAGPNETIIYTAKTTTSLTGCTRGVEGAASDWAVDELIGRNFTAKDHADMVKNIEELENNKLDASYKVDVVNTADVSVGGKALDARQNNPNITGTLAQKVANNTRQINVLKPASTSIFAGDYTTIATETIALTTNITNYNKLMFTIGQGNSKNFNRVVVYSDGYPNNFSVNEIIALDFIDTSFLPSAIALKVTNAKTLTVLDGTARLRVIRGVV